MRTLLPEIHFLLLLLSLVVVAVVVAAVAVVLVAVILIALVVNSISSGCGSSKFLTFTGKYKSAGGQAKSRGPGNTETHFLSGNTVGQSSACPTCSTLLVPLEKLVPPCGFGRYPSNQYFQHTEIQSHACTNLTNSTKAIWIIMFKLSGL